LSTSAITGTGNTSPPSGWVIAGSNDGGKTYTLVTNIVKTPIPDAGYKVFNTNNTVGYSTYILIITNTTGVIGGAANIDRWNIYSSSGVTPTPTPSPPTSDVCFLAGTRIETDQGAIPIEKINPDIHTIRNKKIVAITKTMSNEKYLVCFEKDSIYKNVPSEKTFISQKHNIFYQGKMIPASHFVSDFKNVTRVKYNDDILYNVLLDTHEKMIINNMIVETLHPENKVAKLFRGEFPEHNERLKLFLNSRR
jgi:hypothetical protein